MPRRVTFSVLLQRQDRVMPWRRLMRFFGKARSRRDGRQAGVTLVEFAIVLPVFVATFFALIEFGFAFNAILAINRASQNGALIAAQAGSAADADCQILARVDSQLQAPLDRNDIVDVRIIRANTTGASILAATVYTRSGTKNCGEYTVPYTATSSGYPESQRCDIQAGCPTLTPPRTTVDKIGVQITYRYTPVTPMRELLGFLGNGSTGASWTFSKRNVSRMEPVQ